LRDFTNENISSVYTEGITVGKQIKTKQKKNDDISFLPTKLPKEFIPSVNLLVNCEHCSSCQLQWESPTEFSRELHNCSLSNCTVNCCSLQTKSLTDWKVVGVIWWFSEKIQLIKIFHLNITEGITDGWKNHR